jgi:hypothetical protein
MSDLAWSNPKRVRRSINVQDRHLGYVTLVSYPNRDITVMSEGSPYWEIVISDAQERHVALLQRFKEHWLVQCGENYGTTGRGGILSEAQALQLAQFTLERLDVGDRLVEAVRIKVDSILGL